MPLGLRYHSVRLYLWLETTTSKNTENKGVVKAEGGREKA